MAIPAAGARVWDPSCDKRWKIVPVSGTQLGHCLCPESTWSMGSQEGGLDAKYYVCCMAGQDQV